MSIKVMTLVWDGFPAAGSELLAMLALADWCDDRGGSLYPSIKAVADKVRVGEKHARNILHKFEHERYLAVVGNHFGGKPGTTREYRLNVGKLKLLADDANAKREAERTAKYGEKKSAGDQWEDVFATAPLEVTPNPQVTRTAPPQFRDGSPVVTTTAPLEVTLSTNEPSIEPPKKRESAYAPPLPLDLLNDWTAVRKAKKAGPITKTVMAGIAREAEKANISLIEAVTACCEFGWQGFNAQWYAERTNGKPAAMTASNRQPESFAERDARNKREEWERMTNRSWPAEDLPGARPAAPLVIDITANEPRRIS